MEQSKCLIVTCLPCSTPHYFREAPGGCMGCGMLVWNCFSTEEEANSEYRKQYPEQFDEKGIYVPTLTDKVTEIVNEYLPLNGNPARVRRRSEMLDNIVQLVKNQEEWVKKEHNQQ